jgi:hypothetical protein
MDSHQERFLKDELFHLTLEATVQRAKVYTNGAEENDRKPFQTALQAQLEQITDEYTKPVTEDAHIQNILGLSSSLSLSHGKVLRNGRFRVGLAQKALNLYLKYLWCLGMISEPPHCPFDSRVIANLHEYRGPSWTVLDNDGQYRELIRLARIAAQGLSLARWELKVYNDSWGARGTGTRVPIFPQSG